MCNVCANVAIYFAYQVEKKGIYKLQALYLGQMLVEFSTDTLAIGDDLLFELSGLNEDYTYTFKLLDPDGLVIDLPNSDPQGDSYDCIKVKTIPFGLEAKIVLL